jgi:intracellular multiplication protein IcmK
LSYKRSRLNRLPVLRLLLAASMLMFAQGSCAPLAYAQGTALPSVIPDAQAMPVTGQGQAAYPSAPSTSAPVSDTPASSGSTLTMADSTPTASQTGGKPSSEVGTGASGNISNVTSNTGSLPRTTSGKDLEQPAPTPTMVETTPPREIIPVHPMPAPHSQIAPPSTSDGIVLPSPPPPSAFSNDPNQLAVQAEQAALQAQTQADADQHRKEIEHNVKSFDKASTGMMPLSPDQIRDFMHKLEQTQNAAQFPFEGTPKGQTRIATILLDPGVEPPQINLATGFVTTIAMVDATGEPWPILDVGIGGNFEVSPTQAGTHVVRIMPLTRVGTGDLSVLLKDCPTPVIFRLASGGPTVDLRYDARINKLGPGAKPQIISRPRLEAGDETMTLILENAPPGSAKRLRVGGLDARTKAWSVGEKVYVRTPLTLLSPAWNSSEASADGTTVYEIGNAPVLLMSDNGAMIRAQISRDEDHDK